MKLASKRLRLAVVWSLVVSLNPTGTTQQPTGIAVPSSQLTEPLRIAIENVTRPLVPASASGLATGGERLGRVRSYFDFLKDIHRLMMPGFTTPQSVLAEAGSSPAGLHAWVASRTVLVPYRGALRGATGVLADRSGNSLDRSLLLARLLKAAGRDVRVAHAQLPPDQAEAMWTAMATRTPQAAAPPKVAESASAAPAIAAYLKKIGAPVGDLRGQLANLDALNQQLAADVARRVATQTAMIAKRFEPHSPALGQTERSSEIDALQDHWWVQWQDGADWTDLDPSMPKAGTAIVPADETFGLDEIPAELFHEVTVRVVVEQWDGNAFNESSPFGKSFRPVDLNGHSIVFRHLPLNWPADVGQAPGTISTQRLRAAMLAEREWLPVVDAGDQHLRESSFTETGDLNDKPGSKPSGAAAAAGGIVDAFAGGGPSKPGVLTAEWIEYEIRAPGVEPQKIRREIFDLAGPSRRAQQTEPAALSEAARLDRAASLLGQTEILVLGFQPSPAFVDQQTLESWLENQPALEALAAADAVPSDQSQATVAKLAKLPGPLHNLAVTRAVWRRQNGIQIRKATVLSQHTFPTTAKGGDFQLVSAFDIVSNSVGVGTGGSSDRFRARLQQGVLDAHAEAVMAGAGSSLPTPDLYGFDSANDRWLLLRSEDEVGKTGLAADVRARIAADLNAGFAVLAPKAPLGTASPSWWRINPETGDMMAIGDRGWGQALSDYGLVTTTTVFNVCLYFAPPSIPRLQGLSFCMLAGTGLGAFAVGQTVVLVVSTLGVLAHAFLF